MNLHLSDGYGLDHNYISTLHGVCGWVIDWGLFIF